MSWVRLDDKFTQHPKVLQAGPLGIALYVAGLCYANTHLTDGLIPKRAVAMLLDFSGIAMNMWDSGEGFGGGEDATAEKVAADLVIAGLWEPVDGGWMIHDYLNYQPSREQIKALSQERSDAGKRGAMARWQTDGKGHGKPMATSKQTTWQNHAPTPTPTPTPTPEEETPSLRSGVARKRAPKGTRWPPDQSVSEEWLTDGDIQRHEHDLPRIDLRLEASKFVNYWASKPGAGALKTDWHKTWINWALKAEGHGNGRRQKNGLDDTWAGIAAFVRDGDEQERAADSVRSASETGIQNPRRKAGADHTGRAGAVAGAAGDSLRLTVIEPGRREPEISGLLRPAEASAGGRYPNGREPLSAADQSGK